MSSNHNTRHSISDTCPTCGSAPYELCITGSINNKEKMVEKEWLEYQLFVALHNLKEVAPDHYLVTTVEMALQSKPRPEKL